MDILPPILEATPFFFRENFKFFHECSSCNHKNFAESSIIANIILVFPDVKQGMNLNYFSFHLDIKLSEMISFPDESDMNCSECSSTSIYCSPKYLLINITRSDTVSSFFLIIRMKAYL